MIRNSKPALAVLLLAGGVYAQTPPKQDAPPKPPIFVQKPDGTLIAQKEPPKGSKPEGLVIPKQVVIPFAASPKASKQ